MVATSAAIDDRPSALRYPRGEGVGLQLPERGQVLAIGKGRIVKEGTQVAILNLGTRLSECRKAAAELDARGLSTTIADMRFAKPLDIDLIRRLAARARSAASRSKKVRSAVSAAMCCIIWPIGRLHGSRPQNPHDDAAGYLPGPRRASEAI